MKLTISIFLFLFFVGLSAAFNPLLYLYANETPEDISEETITIDNVEYTAISISGDVTFIVKSGELIQDGGEIDSAITKYYLDHYFPTEEEIQSLKNLIEQYNASRNDGHLVAFGHIEENYCRRVVFVSDDLSYGGEKLRCQDDAQCEVSARLFMGKYRDVISFGIGATEELKYNIGKFANASYGTDEILNKSMYDLNNLDIYNVVDAVEDLHDSVPTLRTYKAEIAQNKFRFPDRNDPVDNALCSTQGCYGVCPIFKLDGNSLTQIESETADLLVKVRHFEDFDDAAEVLLDKTQNRLNIRELVLLSKQYNKTFHPKKKLALELINSSISLFEHVVNTSLENDMARLQNLTDTMESNIKNLQFADIEQNLEEYDNLADEVSLSLDYHWGVYNESVKTRDNASSLLFSLSTQESLLGDSQKSEYDQLLSKYTDLEDKMSRRLSIPGVVNATQTYDDIAETSFLLLGKQKDGFDPLYTLANSFGRFSRRVTKQFYSMEPLANLIRSSPFEPSITFAVVTLIMFISVVSLIIFVLMNLSLGSLTKPAMIARGAIFSTLFLLSLVFFALLYTNLTNAITNATVDDMMQEINASENTIIAVYLEGAPQDAADSMASCAADLRTSLKTINNETKVYIYRIYPANCTLVNELNLETKVSITACETVVNDNPSFLFNYSTEESGARLSAIYDIKGYITGNTDYYRSCGISKAFERV